MASPLSGPPLVHRGFGGLKRPLHRDSPWASRMATAPRGAAPKQRSGGHTVLSQTLRLTEKIHQKVGKGMNPRKKKQKQPTNKGASLITKSKQYN